MIWIFLAIIVSFLLVIATIGGDTDVKDLWRMLFKRHG